VPAPSVHDPDLLDALEALPTKPFAGVAWRVTWASRDPLAGGTGGGRWHPPNDFEALYTSLDENGALAEIYYHLSRAPVFSSSNARLNRLAVRIDRTSVFDDITALTPLGVDAVAFRRGDYGRTREIGAAAHFLDMQALIVPSARWPCRNLVLFPDRLRDAEAVRLLDSHEINWPAWRERVASRE
jgi:hypothetical protein